MKHTKGKKLGLMIFIIAVFLAIPIATAYAQNAMKGDPVIECVSSELILSKERTTSAEEASYGDIIFYLDVQLKTVKHFASSANATLRFKNRASLAVEKTMNGEKSDPKILRDKTTWNAIKRGKAKSALLPFTITGFQRLSEKMEFEMDVTYRNPNDQEIYGTTLSIIPGIPDTTIDITYISNPPNKPKGDSVPITIKVKNTGSNYAYGLAVGVRVKSIEAGTTTMPYANTAGSIVLQSAEIVLSSLEYIAPQQQVTFTYNLPCHGFSNGAMNVGVWKIIRVEAFAYNSPIDIVYENQMISDPEFSVIAKAKSAGQHAVFIYFLWNSGGSGDDWNRINPKPYIIDGGGSIKAGLSRFGTYDSDIPVTFNMIFSYENPSWDLPSAYRDSCEMFDHGDAYAGSQLKTCESDGSWAESDSYIKKGNCGFDILLMAAGRESTEAGGLALFNRAIVCKSGKSTLTVNWQTNIDGVAQHEVAHLFGCEDYPPHPRTKCIMYYSSSWPWRDYLHEYSILPWAHQYPYWCSTCQAIFNTNWNRFNVVR